MTNKMKILIGYDGSECADAALVDLQRAGLPSEVEAYVLAVDEQWLPMPTSYWMMRTSYESSYPVSDEVKELAVTAGKKLQALFPAWKVLAESYGGSPASIILAGAEQWKPDLIVVGSHGRTGIVKLVLGSISQKILHHAPCSVRVARGREMPADAPVKIIVGVDGSTGAEAAVKVVAGRPWPAQTEVLLLSAVPSISAATSSLMVMPVSQWFVEERARVEAAAGKLEKELRTTGLKVRAMILEGDPKSVLLDEAEKWGADCIFVGAAGMSAIDRLLLGSISAAVATRAECSVEVVRSEKA